MSPSTVPKTWTEYLLVDAYGKKRDTREPIRDYRLALLIAEKMEEMGLGQSKILGRRVTATDWLPVDPPTNPGGRP